MQHEKELRTRNDSWGSIVFAVGFVAIGGVLLATDIREYARWPRFEARVVRVASGFGWAVPEYRVGCYPGFDEVGGAKFTFLDGAVPAPGERVMVACQPAAEGIHAYSAADHRALLHRDLVFVLVGAIIGAVALRRRWQRR
jgi:hypothetical protein